MVNLAPADIRKSGSAFDLTIALGMLALLLVVLPLVALVGGATFYLNGGRYVGTDDSYVGAQKVLITPDISGQIEKVLVHEGERVKTGDVLFEIDSAPFRFAAQQAKATLDQAHTTYDNLVANLKIYGDMAALAQQAVDLKQRDVDRIARRPHDRHPRSVERRRQINRRLPPELDDRRRQLRM